MCDDDGDLTSLTAPQLSLDHRDRDLDLPPGSFQPDPLLDVDNIRR